MDEHRSAVRIFSVRDATGDSLGLYWAACGCCHGVHYERLMMAQLNTRFAEMNLATWIQCETIELENFVAIQIEAAAGAKAHLPLQ